MRRILLLLAALVLGLGRMSAAAQSGLPGLPGLPGTAPARAHEDKGQKSPPSAIAAADIPLRAQDAEAQLSEIRETLADRPLDEIAAALTDLLDEAGDLARPSGSSRSEVIRRRDFHDSLLAITNLAARVHDWQRQINQRENLLEAHQKSLAKLETVWSLTRDAIAQKPDAPRAALSKTNELLYDIERVQVRLRERSERLFVLDDRLSATEHTLRERLESLRDVELRPMPALLRRDGAPIWRLFADSAPLPSVTAAELLRSWPGFVGIYRGRLPIDLLLLVLGLLGMRSLAQRVKARPQRLDREVPELLQAPIASTLFVALVVARFAYPKATFALLDALAIVSLGVLAWLISALQPSGPTRKLLWSLIAVLLAYRLLVLTRLNAPWCDLAFLVCAALLAGILWRALRLARLGQLALKTGRLLPALRAFLWAGAIGLGVATLAGLLGLRSLLQYLLDAFVTSAHWLLLAVVFTRLLGGFIEEALNSGTMAHLHMVRNHAPVLRERSLSALNVLAIVIWVVIALGSFDLFDPLYHSVRGMFDEAAQVGKWSFSFGAIIAFLVTLYLGVQLARLVGFFLDEEILPRMSLARGVAPTVSRLTRYLILCIGFFAALGALGVDMGSVALLASALSVGIGFGLQNVVNNFVSGMILIFERPVRVGDTIQVGELVGDVKEIGIRACILQTAQGAEVILPNAELISTKIINWTLSNARRRIDIPLGVAYGSEPAQVISLAISAAQGLSGVAPFPDPACIFVGLGESALNFELRVWAQRNDDWPFVRSAVVTAVYAKLNEAKIEIPFPQRDLHLRSIDEAAARQLKAELPEPSA